MKSIWPSKETRKELEIMIQIQTLEVNGMLPALHGMRNPKNSWAKRDSYHDAGLDDLAGYISGRTITT